MLDGLTRLILVNAVYFKGTWHYQFDPQFTNDMPFHVGSGESTQVPMMAGTVNVRYGTAEGLQILELPYVGKEVSMIILLPKAMDGLKSIEDSLSAEELSSWRKRLKKQDVCTYLPKFTMTCDFELNDALRAMGMVDAFVPSAADLSGITGDRSQYVDAVLHRAFVEVNEEGTEAAATTAIATAADRDAPRRHPPVFRADHPFLFLIQNNDGTILFLGRVVDPRTRSV